MSLEFWSTLATCITAMIIVPTAIAAVVQLRHVSNANRLTVLTSVVDAYTGEKFTEARRFMYQHLDALMQDPAFRRGATDLDHRSEEHSFAFDTIDWVGNFWENLGIQLKRGFIDSDNVMELFAIVAKDHWKKLEPYIAIIRRDGSEGIWENFEYLVVLSTDWLARNPRGSYPKEMRRMPLIDVWLETDTKSTQEARSNQ